jgi:hypothetical protein
MQISSANGGQVPGTVPGPAITLTENEQVLIKKIAKLRAENARLREYMPIKLSNGGCIGPAATLMNINRFRITLLCKELHKTIKKRKIDESEQRAEISDLMCHEVLSEENKIRFPDPVEDKDINVFKEGGDWIELKEMKSEQVSL